MRTRGNYSTHFVCVSQSFSGSIKHLYNTDNGNRLYAKDFQLTDFSEKASSRVTAFFGRFYDMVAIL